MPPLPLLTASPSQWIISGNTWQLPPSKKEIDVEIFDQAVGVTTVLNFSIYLYSSSYYPLHTPHSNPYSPFPLPFSAHLTHLVFSIQHPFFTPINPPLNNSHTTSAIPRPPISPLPIVVLSLFLPHDHPPNPRSIQPSSTLCLYQYPILWHGAMQSLDAIPSAETIFGLRSERAANDFLYHILTPRSRDRTSSGQGKS